MKQKDIALIVVIVLISAIVSLFASKAIFAPPKNRQQQVDVVQPITADFPKPDKAYFNSNAINPTQTITTGPSANPNPFSNASQ